MRPVLLFVISIFVANATAQSIHIPLSRRAQVGPRSMDDYAQLANSLRRKYGYETSSHEQKRQSEAGIEMINHDSDSIYTAPVLVGTPPQKFNLILDTGSTDLWVPTLLCSTCAASIPKFNESASSTYTPSATIVTIRYGSGSVQGTRSQDVVGMGNFIVRDQTYLSVTRTSMNLLRGSISGIIGLAFTPIAATGATPFWLRLLEANQLKEPSMSFQFTRFLDDDLAAVEEPGGIFTLGGTNSSLYQGAIEYLNISATPSFWLLELTRLTLNGLTVETTPGIGSLSAIDTGTTLIGGPTRDVRNFWSAVPGAQALTGQNEGFFLFPCGSKLEVTIAFGGKSWPINSTDMNLGPSGIPGMCLGGIFDLALGSNIGSSGRNPRWVVGDTFLKNVYSVFRAVPPSIGFAQLATPGQPGATPTTARPAATTGGPSPIIGASRHLAAPLLSLAIALLATSSFL